MGSAPGDDGGEEFTQVVFRNDGGKPVAAVAVVHAEHFRPAAVVFGDGFRIAVQAEVGPIFARQIFDFGKSVV